MIDVSNQTDLDATPMDISSDSSFSQTMTGTQTPSTHTFLQLTAPILTSTVQEVSVNTESGEHEVDATPTDISSGSSVSEMMTGTEIPSTHTFLQLTAPILTSTAQEVLVDTESSEHEETRQELADTKAQIIDKDEQIKNKDDEIQNKDDQIKDKDERLEKYESRLTKMKESLDEKTQQYDEIRTQLDDANINIGELKASKSIMEEQAASSQVEVNDLRTKLEEAESRVSEMVLERNTSQNSIMREDRKIPELKHDPRETSENVRPGSQELKSLLQLSTKLYDRLQEAEGAGALVRDDQLMRSAAQELARWNSPLETRFPDVSTETEVVSDSDIATVERPADHPAVHQGETGHVSEESADDAALRQPDKETYGVADTDRDDSGVEVPAVEETEVEEPGGKMRKTSTTASIFAAAARIDLSSSSPSSTAKGKQKEERTFPFGQEGSRIFSFAPSEEGVRAEQTPRYQDPQGIAQRFNLSSAHNLNLFASTAEGEEKEELVSVPAFGAEGSSQSSFPSRGSTPNLDESSDSSVGDSNVASETMSTQTGGKEEQEPDRNESKATSETQKSSSTGGVDFSASSGRGSRKCESAPKTTVFGARPFSLTLDGFASIQEPTDEASNDSLLAAEGASEGQVDSSQSSSTSGTAVAHKDDDDKLYDIEAGYVPPAQRRVEPASTSAISEGEDADGDSTGVPRITITPASTTEHNVEVGSSNILERNGFDVAALSRIVGLSVPAAHETPEAGRRQRDNVERRNLEGGNHGAESLLERLLPREGHYPSYEEATGIRNVVWHGRGRTAEEILRECKKGEDNIALIISGIEGLNLGPSRPSGGSRAPMENVRVEEVGRSAERGEAKVDEPKVDEPQTKAVREDGRATPAAESQPDIPLIAQSDESSSATIIDSTVQPQMELQGSSTALLSASSSSFSYYPSSSVTPATTPPAAHGSQQPERRSRIGNPMDRNGRLYLGKVWPLIRKKPPRVIRK